MRGTGSIGRRLTVGAVVAALVAALSAGGSSTAGAADERATASAAGAKVRISGFKFRPRTLRIRRGTRVVFVNRDSAPHTATRRGSFDTGTLRRGQRAAVRFRRRGTYRYVCTIHPFMKGKIVVR